MPLPELSFSNAVTTWQFDAVSTVLILAIATAYLKLARGSGVGVPTRTAFLTGLAIWWFAANGFTAVYGDVLFWVRTLAFVMLLVVAGFLLASGRPITVLSSHPAFRRRLIRAGRTPVARWLLSPPVTAGLMLVTPWVLFLTPWYGATVDHSVVDRLTQVLLVAIGTTYFYARLQVDPVPRHRHAGLSLLIAVGETLGDGVLGVVLWQGGILDEVARQAMMRDWGPSARTDQTIGAGVLWILGDVLGLPFLMFLFGRWRADDARSAERIDAELADSTPAEVDDPEDTGVPWFLNDPALADRFHRR